MSRTSAKLGLSVAILIVAVGISAVPRAKATYLYTRQADFNAATNVNDGDNTHGGVDDPAGSRWSYQYLLKADRDAHGMDPAYFQDVNAIGASKYQFLSQYTVPGDDPVRLYTIEFAAEAGRLMNYWYEPASNRPYRMADMMAIFTVPETAVYDILGELRLEQQQWYGTCYVIVGTIQSGTFTSLLQETLTISSTDFNAGNRVRVVPNYTGNPNLRGLSLAAGDQIVFGVRGSTGWWIKDYLLDDQAFIFRVPEPASLALLLVGLPAVLGFRRPRNRSSRGN